MARLLWTQKRRIGPAPRMGHAIAFDDARARTVLFGGGDSQDHFYGDTWEWDGEHWTQLDDIGPSPRWRHALAYDIARRQVVLFGGQGLGPASGVFGDTWEWNSEAWTQIADGGLPSRHSHAMAYDSRRNRSVLFGGVSGGALFNDTWEWDGDEWVQVEDTGPAARGEHVMAFDAARGRIVLFGGTSSTAVLGDTWEWDGAVWTQASAIGAPPATAAAMSSTGNRILLFGGLPSREGNAAPVGTTWEWDGRHWTIRQDVGPSPRWDHAMVYDTTRRRSVLVGGTPTSLADPVAPLGDTWEQFERGTTVVTPPPPPGPPGPAPGPAVLQSLTVPPTVQEGQLFTFEVLLTAPTLDAALVHVTVADSAGATVIESDLPVAAGAGGATTPMSGLFPGVYTFTASLGVVTRTASLQVHTHPSLTVTLLTVNPSSVALGQSFDLQVVLSGPVVGPELLVPTRVTLQDGGPQQVFRPIPVASGAVGGTVTIEPFPPPLPESMQITATLGGVERTAAVTFVG